MKTSLFRFILIVCFSALSFYLWRIEVTRIGAFGCFDDCFNIIGGHFLLDGRQLYKEIFFNHQPLGAFMSAGIQILSNPQTMFRLIFDHRLFIAVWNIGWGIFLIGRFGMLGFIPAAFYALIGPYVFANRFLSEAMIASPLGYMTLLMFLPLLKRKIYQLEIPVSAFLTWFVIFSREPFVPVGLALFAILLYQSKNRRNAFISIILFVLITAGTFLYLSLPSYFDQVFVINKQIELRSEHLSLSSVISMIGYPFLLLTRIPTHIFYWFLSAVSVTFLFTSAVVFFHRSQRKIIFFTFLVLGLANIRVVPIGTVYFDAFHMAPWVYMFVIASSVFSFVLVKNSSVRKSLGAVFFFVLCLMLLTVTFFGKIDKLASDKEFTEGYANYFVKGEVVRRLSLRGDTLFVERWDDPIYWQAKLSSPYQYSWYTSIMPLFPKFREARDRMWEETPPSFYVGSCVGEKKTVDPLPLWFFDRYTELTVSGTPSCVYVRNDTLSAISSEKKESVTQFGYMVPEEN